MATLEIDLEVTIGPECSGMDSYSNPFNRIPPTDALLATLAPDSISYQVQGSGINPEGPYDYSLSGTGVMWLVVSISQYILLCKI